MFISCCYVTHSLLHAVLVVEFGPSAHQVRGGNFKTYCAYYASGYDTFMT